MIQQHQHVRTYFQGKDYGIWVVIVSRKSLLSMNGDMGLGRLLHRVIATIFGLFLGNPSHHTHI